MEYRKEFISVVNVSSISHVTYEAKILDKIDWKKKTREISLVNKKEKKLTSEIIKL